MRADILRGPAVIVFNGVTFYSKDDIKVQMMTKTNPIFVSNWGKVDERDEEIAHRLSFTPDGRWTALSTLFPYATALVGSSVFGAADVPLTIWTRDGKKRVYKAGAITKMPNPFFGSTKTLFNELEFTCLGGDGTNRGDVGSLFTDSAVSYPGDTGYVVSDILTQPYALAWLAAFTFTVNTGTEVLTVTGTVPANGTRVRLTNSGGGLPAGVVAGTDYYITNRTSSTCQLAASYALSQAGTPIDLTTAGTGTHTGTPYGFSSFYSKEGISVEFSLQLEPEFNDRNGLFDYTFQGLEVTARLIPEGPTVEDMTTALLHQGSGAARGRSLGSFAQNLNITGTGVYVRLYNAALRGANEGYGSSVRRVGAAEWFSTRSITAGVADPLFYVGASAPA